MSNPTCSISSLIESFPQFAGNELSDKQRAALKVLYKANELAAIGGTNYTANFFGSGASSLLNASNAIFNRASDDQLSIAQLAIAYKNAVASGASVSASPSVFASQIAQLMNANDDDLKKFNIFLDCALGVHKSYPQ
jgi:hypothetical protein